MQKRPAGIWGILTLNLIWIFYVFYSLGSRFGLISIFLPFRPFGEIIFLIAIFILLTATIYLFMLRREALLLFTAYGVLNLILFASLMFRLFLEKKHSDYISSINRSGHFYRNCYANFIYNLHLAAK